MNEPLICDSVSEDQTQKLAEQVAVCSVPGLVITLDGELGSGKTAFVRAFSLALGADPALVNSPTFVLLQYYAGSDVLIAHMDAYRLEDADEFLAIGGDEVLASDDSICLVEWAERIRELLPPDRLAVQIMQTGAQQRRFEFTAAAGHGAAVLQKLRQQVAGLPP